MRVRAEWSALLSDRKKRLLQNNIYEIRTQHSVQKYHLSNLEKVGLFCIKCCVVIILSFVLQ